MYWYARNTIGVEMFKKNMDYGQAGDNVGILLRGLKREDVRRGQVIVAPGTLKTYKKFKVRLFVQYISIFIQ